MNVYLLMHTHHGGQDKYVFFSDHGNLSGFFWKEEELDENTKKVIKRLRINYIPEREESIEISWMFDREHQDMVPYIFF
jgi:hypothetical protein